MAWERARVIRTPKETPPISCACLPDYRFSVGGSWLMVGGNCAQTLGDWRKNEKAPAGDVGEGTFGTLGFCG